MTVAMATAKAMENTTAKWTAEATAGLLRDSSTFVAFGGTSARIGRARTLDLGALRMSTPELFTVTEAAVVLRIGRTTAYELARRDLAAGGGEGLGVIRVGGRRPPECCVWQSSSVGVGGSVAVRFVIGRAVGRTVGWSGAISFDALAPRCRAHSRSRHARSFPVSPFVLRHVSKRVHRLACSAGGTSGGSWWRHG